MIKEAHGPQDPLRVLAPLEAHEVEGLGLHRGGDELSGAVAVPAPLPEEVTKEEVVHPVSVRRFPSFRTQPLENLSRYQ